jgi:hypothetical protein
MFLMNVMVEWLTLLLRIREVHDSNLRPETAILTEGFPHSLKANAGMVPEIRPRLLPSTSFSNHHSPIFLLFVAMARVIE